MVAPPPIPQALALLHAHTFTAYPLGCAAALASLTVLQSPDLNPNICTRSKSPTSDAAPPPSASPSSSPPAAAASHPAYIGPMDGALTPLWDAGALDRISRRPAVERVVAIGTVLAVELKKRPIDVAEQQWERTLEGGNCDGAGHEVSGSAGAYLSGSEARVMTSLRSRGVFTRPLGPTVYMLVTPTTEKEQRARLMAAMEAALDEQQG